MVEIMMSAHQRPALGHRSITRKASFSDDEDAITPCSSPPPEPQDLIDAVSAQEKPSPKFTPSRSGSTSGAAASSRKTSTTTTTQAWHFDPTAGEAMTDSQLWLRMLEIQRTFHCYNSARMSAALLELEMGVDAGHLAPSRSCLDLMNESISDLTDEERRRLADWLSENGPARKRSGTWRRSLNF
ncbi:hypothetical protein M406DRAFT_356051 [Cryphonectria parasitica EP155]|uniref:Uncharacterized protein n=1 Tax=Cryphonectria parasitica (strain ATCC 38755 / EP155) TaxID=660469 RepID=A0A9P5CPU4_CRYP1|nr:uncharacterized protein M406DRAFT_356051 [Cryphonectria parasitica EP155]KAF3765782.1 hypothetical protein M406DRAFT_356051 [Cryphonectria parasitica EP155]